MRRFLPVVTAALASLVIALCAHADDNKPKMTTEQIETLVKQELPLGTSRSSVVSFLDKQGLEHSGHAAGAPSDLVYAIFRDVQGSTSTVSKSVQVTFRFANHRLSGYSFKELFTGP